MSIAEACEVFRCPHSSLQEKLEVCYKFPVTLERDDLQQEDWELFYKALDLEVLDLLLDDDPGYPNSYVKGIELIAYCAQRCSPLISARFAGMIPKLIDFIKDPRRYRSDSILLQVATSIAFIPFDHEKVVYVTDSLKIVCRIFIGQKQDVDITNALSVLRLLLSKLMNIVRLPRRTIIDDKVWGAAIMSICRNVVRTKTENLTEEVRTLNWTVICFALRILGHSWFQMDRQFAFVVASMNFAELQMAVYRPDAIDINILHTHVRILEKLIDAADDETLLEEECTQFFCVIGDSSRFVVRFFLDSLKNESIKEERVKYTLFSFCAFLVHRDNVTLLEKSSQDEIGPAMFAYIMDIFQHDRMELTYDMAILLRRVFSCLTNLDVLSTILAELIATYFYKISIAFPMYDVDIIIHDVTYGMMEVQDRTDAWTPESIDKAMDIVETIPEKHRTANLCGFINDLALLKTVIKQHKK